MSEPDRTTRTAVGTERTDVAPLPRPAAPARVGPVYAPPPGVAAAVGPVEHPVLLWDATVVHGPAVPMEERTAVNRGLPATPRTSLPAGRLDAPPFAPPGPPAWHAPAAAPAPQLPLYVGSPPPARPCSGPVQSGSPAPHGRPARRLSVARFYYAALAILGVVLAIAAHQPKVLIASAVCAVYAIYLFRGGRFVIWIW